MRIFQFLAARAKAGRKIENIMAAIRADIPAPTTKAEMEKAEAERKHREGHGPR